MTMLSKRRSRILRVRTIEHRIAAMKQLAAEQRVAELLGVSRRLDDLRNSLTPCEGSTLGANLQAKSELSMRLTRAEMDLKSPIQRAEIDQREAAASRLVARAREEGAERLRAKALTAEEQVLKIRLDANGSFRTNLGGRR